MKNKLSILIGFILIVVIFFYLNATKKEPIKINVPRGDAFSYINQENFFAINNIREVKIVEKHIQAPKNIRAVYMSSWIASSVSLRSKLVDFIVDSEVNTIVLDIKDYSGLIAFDIDHPLIDNYKTDSKRIPDISNFIKELHSKNIYIIGRLTLFQDPLLAQAKPELAFKRLDNGEVWKDKKGLAFINPQKEDAWEYFAVIAEESHKLGFDEINFDYIRYPSDGNISNLNYSLNGKKRTDVMKSFYEFLDNRLRTQNIPISADLFGLTTALEDDLSIGQDIDDALVHFDAVAPMVYPSHYNSGYLGFSNPADHPYEMIYSEMTKARLRAERNGLKGNSLRTWIQDFDLGADYEKDEIKAQIKASYDAGIYSYMVWDPKNIYTKSAYYNNIKDNDNE